MFGKLMSLLTCVAMTFAVCQARLLNDGADVRGALSCLCDLNMPVLVAMEDNMVMPVLDTADSDSCHRAVMSCVSKFHKTVNIALVEQNSNNTVLTELHDPCSLLDADFKSMGVNQVNTPDDVGVELPREEVGSDEQLEKRQNYNQLYRYYGFEDRGCPGEQYQNSNGICKNTYRGLANRSYYVQTDFCQEVEVTTFYHHGCNEYYPQASAAMFIIISRGNGSGCYSRNPFGSLKTNVYSHRGVIIAGCP